MRRAILAAVCAAACLPDEPPVADHIDCESGACECSAGFGNCDGEPDNGCEADLATDPRNCSACGIDCLGGPCTDAACQPYDPAPGLNGIYYPLAIDGRVVYFGDIFLGTIARVGDDGGPVASVAGDQLLMPNKSQGVLAVSGTRVYWDVLTLSGGEAVHTIDQAGGPSHTVSSSTTVAAVAAGADRLAWSDSAGASGGSRVVLAEASGAVLAEFPSALAFPSPYLAVEAGGAVVWVDPDGYTLWRGAADGTQVVLYQAEGYFSGLSVSGEQIVWTEAETSKGDVLRAMPSRGGAPTDLFASAKFLDCPSSYDGTIYWVEGTSSAGATMWSVPLDGGEAQPVATITVEYCPAAGERIVAWSASGRLYALAR